MHSVWAQAWPRILAILGIQASVVLVVVGVIDYARGTDVLPATVPVCATAACVPLPETATRAVLDAAGSNRDALETLFATRNLCAAPTLALVTVSPEDPTLPQFIDAFDVTGIARIAQTGDLWEVSAGHAVNSWTDPFVKLFHGTFAENSCEEPWMWGYGILALIGLLPLFGFLLIRTRRRP